MTVVFDGSNKLVLPQETVGVLNIKYVYSRWKEWVIGNSNYEQAFTTVGGDPITSDDNIPPYYYLMNGWRVKWPDGDISVEVQGNLLVYGGQDTPYRPVDSKYSYNVTSVVGANVKMTPAEFTELMDGYANKHFYKADLTQLEKGVNITSVTGEGVAGIDDFKSDVTDLTEIKDAIGNLHDFDPTNDVVSRVALVDKTTENVDMVTPNEMTEAELHNALDSYNNKADWKDSAVVDEATLHSALDTYSNKDDYKADVSNLSANVNVIEVNGVAVESVKDFMAEEVNLTPVTERLDKLHNFNPTSDTVIVRETLDKPTSEDFHAILDDYSNKDAWKTTSVDLAPVITQVNEGVNTVVEAISKDKEDILTALEVAKEKISTTLSVIATLVNATNHSVQGTDMSVITPMMESLLHDMEAIKVKVASKEAIAEEVWNTEL